MNILIYNCEYATISLLEKLVEKLKITQIHVLNENLNSLLRGSKIEKMVTVKPIKNKEDEDVEPSSGIMYRSICAIMNQISKPIFENGQFIGFDILPTYKQGSKYDFYSNLELDHPNILVLQYGKYEEEYPEEYGYKSCLARFIRNYDDIEDPCLEHICMKRLKSEFYVDTYDVEHDFKALQGKVRVRYWGCDNEEYIPLLILHSLKLNSFVDFFKMYYSTEGFINCCTHK